METKSSGEVNGVPISNVSELNSTSHDAVVLVTFPISSNLRAPQAVEDFVAAAVELDQALNKSVAVLSCPRVSGGRLVLSPTGPITPYDDVRSVGEAAKRGVERAIQAGCRKPLLVVQFYQDFSDSDLVLLLGAFEALYVPIQIREYFPEKSTKLLSLGVYGEGLKRPLDALIKNAIALETSRSVARDIGGGDPERMAPAAVARHVAALFRGSRVAVRAQHDAQRLREDYPLFAAVSRAADSVERHRGCVIFLEYTPPTYEQTVLLVGKGVTYDTGGCDIKAGGVMAGMSRDKCGAAAVAGFFMACHLLQPDLKVVGAMSMVRNSVGEEAYVADELIVSRNGKAVRVGNTDAEGRMIMADLLCEMNERAQKEKNPHIYTIATLTGHAHRAVGDGYTIVMDNHAARRSAHGARLRARGEALADMLEESSIRREDLRTHRGRGAGDDVLQALNQPSTAVPRGHQGPAAFLLMTSDLDQGDVPYSHLDIAASGGSLPEQPTGAPLLALANFYKLIKY